MQSLIKRLQETLNEKDYELSSTVEELRTVVKENYGLSKRIEDLEKQMKMLRNLNEILRRKLLKKNKLHKSVQTLRK